ncbi:carbohydrate kinase family protein [Paenibacillus sp. CGMCC 1.16610]|uniref:Carbohydrate kinase family protein n=1 Tax=Paenibacillus anseongense TaxID=2682845 RepID=A0ABW9U5L0_9BACL|nr:carbohydrate kinase family protein [Paenibacillus sp. CGMCC 1.16610]MBA2943114.1 carbohydrate kinase family protein [Paenibacillus sp. CGMCC 1.16610]MVQ33610.1 carbohydrate kinase family protein [Paenibacillus anseongense]
MKKFDAVVIGDVNIDLVVVGCNQIPQPGQEIFVDNMMMHVGGGAALFTIALAKLGLHVAFDGVLGNDGYGHYIRERFAGYGIDTSMVRTSGTSRTGITIAINPELDRSFITYVGSNAELHVEELDLGQIALGRHVHVTGYRGRRNHTEFVAMAKRLKEAGATISCDVGWDDTGEWYSGVFELMQHVDVFLMNETEALHYTGFERIEDSLSYMSGFSPHVVIKLGPQGAAAMKDGLQTMSPGFPVEAVDTTGAGDSFNAGYIYGFLTGLDVETCLLYGNVCGALSVGAYGGSTGTPDHEGLEAFIRLRQNS